MELGFFCIYQFCIWLQDKEQPFSEIENIYVGVGVATSPWTEVNLLIKHMFQVNWTVLHNFAHKLIIFFLHDLGSWRYHNAI